MKSRLLIIIIFSLLTVGIIYAYNYSKGVGKKESSMTVIDNNPQNGKNDSGENVVQEPEIVRKRYDETPSEEGSLYFEKYPVVNGQQAYIAYPLEIEVENPPRLVIYHHGSNTNVTTNMNDQFMKDLQFYGEFFTSKGYAFAASNQHGMNYGNKESIDDVSNLIEWIEEKYMIKEEVSMLGFSMGGLPAIYYANQYPSKVHSLALLAPVTYVWGSSIYTNLEGIPIKIWHGDRDFNVGYEASTGFIQRGRPYKLTVELRTVEGGGHFDIDTEYAQEIFDFLESIGNEKE